QSFSLDVFSGDKMQGAGHCIDGADFVNRNDVRVVERGGGAGLLLKAAHAIGFLGKLFEQDFESEFAAQPLVYRQVNLAHPACAQLADNAIVRNRLSDHKRGASKRKSRTENRRQRNAIRSTARHSNCNLRSTILELLTWSISSCACCTPGKPRKGQSP